MKTPFLWAGSKDRYFGEVRSYIPSFSRYFEPFLGGGAIYFRLLAARGSFPAFCSDVNEDLINAYEAIRDDPEGVVAKLPETKDRETFDRLRNMEGGSVTERAARFLYLNRNRFFGLGGWMQADRYARSAIIDRIRFFSPLMARTTFSAHGCWSLPALEAGDFVFCDPPYPDTNNAACYRVADDVLDLNIAYLRHVQASPADFFFISKRVIGLEDVAKDLPGVTVETRLWDFRKPGESVQQSEEICVRREAHALISI